MENVEIWPSGSVHVVQLTECSHCNREVLRSSSGRATVYSSIVTFGPSFITIFKIKSSRKKCSKGAEGTLRLVSFEKTPAGIWCQNDVVSTSMRRHHVISTLIECLFTSCARWNSNHPRSPRKLIKVFGFSLFSSYGYRNYRTNCMYWDR